VKRIVVLGLAAVVAASACASGGARTAERFPRPKPSPVKGPPSTPRTQATLPRPIQSVAGTASPAPRSSATPSSRPSATPPTRWAAPALPSWLAGHDLTVLPTGRKVVALTFDAGANADGIPSILSALQASGVPATFFLTGEWVQRYPGEARQIGARYAVANHTFDHPDLTALSDTRVREEISTAEAAIRSATGRDPKPMFRFPFGASNARLVGVANSLGYGCFRWTVDTLGWKGTVAGTADDIVRRVLTGLQPGEIVIMHVGSNPDDHTTLDADSLPKVIEALKARGYGFSTIDQFF
jgi:peptidoglycan/xylan/chitin deacetylase (PgdA/CDA1 family)